MGITNVDVNKFIDFCKSRDLEGMFLKDVNGNIIKDNEWYEWVLTKGGEFLNGDIYDYDLLCRYNFKSIIALFNDTLVLDYCVNRLGLDFGDMLKGLGGAYSVNGIDGVKNMVECLREMYAMILAYLREDSQLVVGLKSVEFAYGDYITLTFRCKFFRRKYRNHLGKDAGSIKVDVWKKNRFTDYLGIICGPVKKEDEVLYEAMEMGYLGSRFMKEVWVNECGRKAYDIVGDVIKKLIKSYKSKGFNERGIAIDLPDTFGK